MDIVLVFLVSAFFSGIGYLGHDNALLAGGIVLFVAFLFAKVIGVAWNEISFRVIVITALALAAIWLLGSIK